MTIPSNRKESNPITIRRIVTSRGDCLEAEERYQIVLIEKGAVLHREPDRRRVIRDRHLLLIPPGEGAQLRVAVLSSLCQACFYDSPWLRPVSGGRIQVFCLPEDLAARVRLIFSQMLEEQEARRPGYQRMIGLRMEEIGLLLERLLPGACPPEPDGAVPGIGETIGFIQSHYAEELSLAVLAQRCNLTPSYFSRAFKEKTGTPVFEYINRLRIEKACRLLKRTKMPVIDIAFTVGYNNISFFNRYFRKLNGMSPREYRKYIRT